MPLYFRHFQETNHTYAMQLGRNCVWDYAGDNFVHRLVANKADGKMVELVDEAGNPVQEEKLTSLELEVRPLIIMNIFLISMVITEYIWFWKLPFCVILLHDIFLQTLEDL